MRMAFGLAGLLVTIGVIVVLMGIFHPADTARRGQKAQDEVRQMAGIGENGVRTMDSITLEPQLKGGRVGSVLVTDIMKDGPMEKFFGLQRNDSIVQIIERGSPQDVKEFDGDLAKALILQAYQTQGQLVVIRDGQRLTLPIAPPSSPKSSPLQQQLDAVTGPR